MNINELKELISLLGALESQDSPATETQSELIGKYVIVRCRDAGVHAGILERIEGRTVTLSKSRRLWYWVSGGKAHSLSGVAEYGLAEGSKIPPMVSRIELLEACEVISTTSKAANSIYEWPVHEVN